jgi:hypothetical protein
MSCSEVVVLKAHSLSGACFSMSDIDNTICLMKFEREMGKFDQTTFVSVLDYVSDVDAI